MQVERFVFYLCFDYLWHEMQMKQAMNINAWSTLQSSTVFNELGNGHGLCTPFHGEVFYVPCSPGGSAALRARLGPIPAERGRDFARLQPLQELGCDFQALPMTKAADGGW